MSPLPKVLSLLSAALAFCLIVWGAATANSTVVKAETFLIDDGWAAIEDGDWRLAASSFSTAMDQRGLSAAPLEGMACVGWITGYQDYALWSHQLFLGIKSRALSADNACLGDLSVWGIAKTTVNGYDQLFPKAVVSEEELFEAIALDTDAAPENRYRAMACLSHNRDLRLLASIHLQGLAALLGWADSEDQPIEPAPPALRACIDGLLPDYRLVDNAVAATDMFDRLLIGNYSPLPPEDSPPLPMPAPSGPDGRPVDANGASSG